MKAAHFRRNGVPFTTKKLHYDIIFKISNHTLPKLSHFLIIFNIVMAKMLKNGKKTVIRHIIVVRVILSSRQSYRGAPKKFFYLK